MKILVTGVKGQLGYDVMKVLAERKIEAVGADIEEFDITLGRHAPLYNTTPP